MDGQVKMVDAAAVMDWMAEDRVVIVDVREEAEWRARHIPGSRSVPLSVFDPSRIPAVQPGKMLLLHCQSAIRCRVAADQLVASGYKGEINRLAGGLSAWISAGGPVV